MSEEDLERYEADIELALVQEYRTVLPLFNYVAHVRLLPVTDGDRTFWHWECRFTTRAGEEQRVKAIHDLSKGQPQ